MVSIAALLSFGPTWVQADSSAAARSVIGPRTDCASCWRAAAILLLLDRPNAQHEAGHAVALVDLQQPIREPHRLVDLAVLEHRHEGAAEQFRIARIAAQRHAVVDRRRGGVAGDAGMARGQIAARNRNARERGRRLRPLAGLSLRAGLPACLCLGTGGDRPNQQGRKRRQGRPQDRNWRNHDSVNSIWRRAHGAAA